MSIPASHSFSILLGRTLCCRQRQQSQQRLPVQSSAMVWRSTPRAILGFCNRSVRFELMNPPRRNHQSGQAASHPPDAPDTRLGLNTIEILESVPPAGGFAGRTGHRLFEIIEPIAITATPSVAVRYNAVSTKREFFEQINRIELEARTQRRKPVLHVEAHGN